MKHTVTRSLYDYWNELRGDRVAPVRSDLDPRAIAPLLESTFILEHSETAAPRFRLAGTKLCDQFGMELRGMSALSLWHGEGRGEIRDLLRGVVETPGVGLAACTVETRSGYLFEAEFLFLPLYSDMGPLNRILGCGSYIGARDAAVARSEPVHHWVDASQLTPIDGAVQPTAPSVERPARDAQTTRPMFRGRVTPNGFNSTASALRGMRGGKVADLAARRARQPMLYAIEGGVSDQNAPARLISERERRAAGDGARAHLRVVADSDD